MSYMLHVVAICILGQKLSAEAAENEVAEMLDQTFSMRREWILIKKPEKIEILNNWYLGQIKNEWHHGTGNAIPLQQEIIYCWLQVGYFIVFYEDLRPITMINWSRFVATWSQYHIKRILSLMLTPTYTLMFARLYCEMVIGANLCSLIFMILFMLAIMEPLCPAHNYRVWYVLLKFWMMFSWQQRIRNPHHPHHPHHTSMMKRKYANSCKGARKVNNFSDPTGICVLSLHHRRESTQIPAKALGR